MDLSALLQGGSIEDLKSRVLAALGSSGAQHSGLIDEVLKLIGGQAGGLGGLLSMFEGKGLGGLVSSWISNGPNLPLDPSQLLHGLGADKVSEIAGRLGLSTGQVQSGLSAVLPEVVNQLTPGGSLPSLGGGGGGGLGDLGALAGKLFK